MDPDVSKYTSIDCGMQYIHICSEWDEDTCRNYCSKAREAYSKYTQG